MRFTVPQFIEREAKIVGPMTFRQFIFIAIAGAICFFIYNIAPFSVFVIACIVFGGSALALAFLEVQGRSLPVVLSNLLRFNLAPKMYLWKKREIPIKILKKKTIVQPEKEPETPLKIAEKSQLKKLRTEIETKPE